MSRVVAAVLVLAGVALGHTAHRMVDPLRVTTAEDELRVMPAADALKVASSGFHQPLADVFWIQTLFEFGARFGQNEPRFAEWLKRSLQVVTTLDPEWRTPYFYGGTMMRVEGELEASNDLFMAGAETFPDDHWFPFSIGMNHFFMGDMEKASEWVEAASQKPTAPDWYGEAAVACRLKEQSNQAALQYLDSELQTTTDPDLRSALQQRRATLLHEIYVEELQPIVASYEQQTGRTADLEALKANGWIQAIPPDPLGGTWQRDIDGVFRSSVAVEERAAQDLTIERKMVKSWARPKKKKRK